MAKEKKVEQITDMEVDFAQWFTDVCTKAELVDYSGVKGLYILRPYGYAIWENIQQIMDAAAECGRKVAVTGRSMENVTKVAMDLGYMKPPKNTVVDINKIKSMPLEKQVIVTTGSQGEEMSALYRMAFSQHKQIEVGPGDRVIISASAIPGNENTVSRVINELFRKGVEVIYDRADMLHVSGHACQEELKIIHALTKPKYFIPVHGEQRMLQLHKDLALQMGMDRKNIVICDNGDAVEIGARSMKCVPGYAPAGEVFVDGYGVGDVGSVVLRDRKHLGQDGIIVGRVGNDGNARGVLSGRAQHGGTTDIDVLDGIREGDLGVGDGLLELVQVDDDQVDQLNAVLSGLLHVLLGIATGKQRAVNLGMQGLNAAVHHLGIARELLDGGYGNARVLDGTSRAARRDDLDAKVVNQRPCEIDDARLIGNRDQRACDLHIRSHAVLLSGTPPCSVSR